MNIVFFGLIAVSVAAAAFRVASGGDPGAMAAVGAGALEGAKSSVDLAIRLAGSMILFMGLMKIIEKAGLLDGIARVIRPAMVRLFPDVPADHPAMSAMILNLSANVLGLGNAATPFGIRAMEELQKLNRHPGTATNAMVLFLAINTAGVAVFPRDVIAARASLGSADPAATFVTTLVVTSSSAVFAIVVTKLLQRAMPPPERPETWSAAVPWTAWIPLVLGLGAFVGLVVAVARIGEAANAWVIPSLIFGMVSVGVRRGVRVYEAFVEGAKDGIESTVRIVPYLVAILSTVAMFRASGAMDLLVGGLAPLLGVVGFPPEVLPLVLLRPFSGSGGLALTTELMKTYGTDSYIGLLASTMNGSMETTFYVLAVYFGAVGITRSRHAVASGVLTDLVGVIGSVIAVKALLG